MPLYIHGRKEWSKSFWKEEHIASKLAMVRYRQGRLLGRMEGMGAHLRSEANLHILNLDILGFGEIGGEILHPDAVRSSIARRLGLDVAGMVPAGRPIESIVEMMLDATQNCNAALTQERLFTWHAAMYPARKAGIHRQVAGKENVHFQTPNSDVVVFELNKFLNWFNLDRSLDPVIKAAIAHLWFVTIRPFDDGNARIAGAITDMQLSRADESTQRFYSIYAQICSERNGYYDIVESSQKGSLDITAWLDWFLQCLDRVLTDTDKSLGVVMKKARFWERHSTSPFNDRQRTMINKLLGGFDGKLSSSNWARIMKTSQDTAGRDIADLLQRGILAKQPGGGRSTCYLLAPDLT